MQVPELVYQFTRVEPGGTLIGVCREEENSDTATVVTITSSFLVPDDKLLIVSNACVIGVPGASQECLRVALNMHVDETDNSIQVVHSPVEWDPALSKEAGTRIAVNLPSPLWVPPGGRLEADGVFSAGTNTNHIRLRYHATMIPRGNFQQG